MSGSHAAPRHASGEGEKKKRGLVILILILVLIVVALAALVGFLLLRPAQTAETAGGGVGLTIDENAGAYTAAETEAAEEVSLPGVAIPGWGSISIPAGVTEVTTVDFFNPEANEGWYYLTFELRIEDDSEQGYEVLYTSGLVPPGDHVQKITLEHTLDAGTYDAVVHVQPYMMDDSRTATNNADMKTTLVVY